MARVNLDEETEVDDEDIAWGDEGEPDEDETRSGAIISINGKVMGNLDDLVKQPTEEFKGAMRGIVERALPKVDPEAESIFALAKRKMAVAQREGVELINASQIRADSATQMRAALNADTVSEYADIFYTSFADWWPFPPLVVFDDGETFWLADGFHRLLAFQKHHHIQGNPDAIRPVPVLIHKGTRRDAILHAAGANADHGLRRTNADKRKAVEVVLKDQEWRQWSDTEIARRCKVDPKTVASVREKLDSTMEIHSEMRRKTADGRTMNVENIGRKAEPETHLPIWELERRVDAFANQEANPHDGRSSDDVVYALKSQAKSPVKSGTFLERLAQSITEWHSRNDLLQAINNVADRRRQRANKAAAKKVYLPPESQTKHIPFKPIAGGSIVGTNLSIEADELAAAAKPSQSEPSDDQLHVKQAQLLDAIVETVKATRTPDSEPTTPAQAAPLPEPTRSGLVEVLATDTSIILLERAIDDATVAELDAAIEQLTGKRGAAAAERKLLLYLVRRVKVGQIIDPPTEAIRTLVNMCERSPKPGSVEAAAQVRTWLEQVTA